ncbi:MAG TPA: cupredoxin domain-containing protein [Actinomycetota bacterium]
MRTSTRLGALIAASVLLLAACGGDDDPTVEGGGDAGGAGDIQVAMVDNSFAPSTLELTAGEEVTISTPNNGQNPHSFTIDDLGVDTGVLEAGEGSEVTFTVPEGETQYYCTVHGAEVMSGTITAG